MRIYCRLKYIRTREESSLKVMQYFSSDSQNIHRIKMFIYKIVYCNEARAYILW